MFAFVFGIRSENWQRVKTRLDRIQCGDNAPQIIHGTPHNGIIYAEFSTACKSDIIIAQYIIIEETFEPIGWKEL